MGQKPPENLRNFQSLVEVMKSLRGPEGCPWDKQQTHESLTRFAIEEAHELAEAIDTGDMEEVKSELGDLLLQVVLHAEIARQDGHFAIDDVIETLNEKMVRRHPHVFSETEVSGAKEVTENWEQIKQKEKAAKNSGGEFPFSFGLPKMLPSLLGSYKIGEKTKKYNFDWPELPPVIEKVKEELSELEEAVASGDKVHCAEELGDLLFSVAQVARHLEIDPEQALRNTNQKFEKRFQKVVKAVGGDPQKMNQYSSEELEVFWEKAKKQ